jgi:hypothetical protein
LVVEVVVISTVGRRLLVMVMVDSGQDAVAAGRCTAPSPSPSPSSIVTIFLLPSQYQYGCWFWREVVSGIHVSLVFAGEVHHL